MAPNKEDHNSKSTRARLKQQKITDVSLYEGNSPTLAGKEGCRLLIMQKWTDCLSYKTGLYLLSQKHMWVGPQGWDDKSVVTRTHEQDHNSNIRCHKSETARWHKQCHINKTTMQQEWHQKTTRVYSRPQESDNKSETTNAIPQEQMDTGQEHKTIRPKNTTRQQEYNTTKARTLEHMTTIAQSWEALRSQAWNHFNTRARPWNHKS